MAEFVWRGMSLNPILDIIFFIVRLCNDWRSIMVNVLKCEAWICNEQCSDGQSAKLRSHGIKNWILYQLILFVHLQVIQFLNLFFSIRAKFRSSNLWVMSPPHFHYTTLICEKKGWPIVICAPGLFMDIIFPLSLFAYIVHDTVCVSCRCLTECSPYLACLSTQS